MSERRTFHPVKCAICGTDRTYSAKEYNNLHQPKTCGGKDCIAALRSRSRRLTPKDAHRVDAIKASPLAGPVSTHFSAKEWSLLSPNGRVYRFRNLSLFLRENSSLFDVDDVLPRKGNAMNASAYLGQLRPERGRSEWKGWRWYHGDTQ